jgi:hypothetical protein
MVNGAACTHCGDFGRPPFLLQHNPPSPHPVIEEPARFFRLEARTEGAASLWDTVRTEAEIATQAAFSVFFLAVTTMSHTVTRAPRTQSRAA